MPSSPKLTAKIRSDETWLRGMPPGPKPPRIIRIILSMNKLNRCVLDEMP